jgi:hypothetical protein
MMRVKTGSTDAVLSLYLRLAHVFHCSPLSRFAKESSSPGDKNLCNVSRTCKNIFGSDRLRQCFRSIQGLELAAATILPDAKVYVLQLPSIAACSFIPSISFLVHHAFCISYLLPRCNLSAAQARPNSRVLASARTPIQRQSLG